MSLFGPREQRFISYQSVFGTGGVWPDQSDARVQPPPNYNAWEAIRLSAVRACVRLLASTISQLPFRAYRDASGFGQEMSPQPTLIATPSGVLLPSDWVFAGMVSMLLWGNAYGAVVSRDANERPTQVEWLPPWQVRVDQPSIGVRPTYFLHETRLDTADVLHLRNFVVPGSPLGLAPLERDGLVDLNRRAQDFGRTWFQEGASPSAILYSDKELNEQQSASIKERFMAALRKRRGGPAVLGSGLKYEAVSVPADQSQFLATIRHAQVDVCMSFGVAPEKIGIAVSGQSVTYGNREQNQAQYLTDTVNHYLVRWQEALTDVLPRPQYVRFNTGALLRSDILTRYQVYAIAVDKGILEVEECRALEDMAPKAGAHKGSPTELADIISKGWRGVNLVMSDDEFRELLNTAGAGLPVPGPELGAAHAPIPAATPVTDPNAADANAGG